MPKCWHFPYVDYYKISEQGKVWFGENIFISVGNEQEKSAHNFSEICVVIVVTLNFQNAIDFRI